jgi:hypothetical protein
MLGRSWGAGRRLRRCPAAALLLASIGLGLGSSRCITEDGRCSTHQVTGRGSVLSCECAPGYVLDEDGVRCVSCGAHAQADGNRCVCEAGYAREREGEPCEKVEGSAAGSDCSEAEPCTDPNPYCAQPDASGYCTQSGCTRNDDCTEKWLCADSGDEKYCRKPPAGLGDTCASSADCADKEARYCEAIVAHECMVNDCVQDPSVCPSQFVCCDVRTLINESICVPTGRLVNGMCPGGGRLVTP